MKNVVIAAIAGLAILAGAAVVDAHRAHLDRGTLAGDFRVGQGGGRGPGGAAQGPGRGGPGRGGPGRLGGPMLEALNLTDDQRAKIQEIQRTSRESGGPVMEELGEAQRALHQATFAESRDDGAITKLTATIGNLEKQLLDLRVKTDLEIAGVLTAEQREKVRTSEGRGRGR